MTDTQQLPNLSALNKEQIRQIVNNALDAIVVMDDKGLLVDWNSQAEVVFGWSRQEVVGQLMADVIIPPQHRAAHRQGLEHYLATGEGPVLRQRIEITALRKNGDEFPVELTVSPIQLEEGIIFSAFVRDISEYKQKESEAELAKRAAELETVAQVATAASTTLETDKLLQGVVDLTKERFGLYHAHIYLLDIVGDTLDLTAGAGEVGRKMVAQGWRIPFAREQSLVARAARRKKGIIVNDVQADPNFFPNPLLPDTRSEMAVPMLAGDRVLGVLDVQADAVDHFTDEDVYIQTTLAVQVATALENARLFEESHKTTSEIEAQAKRLALLSDLGPELNRAANLNEVYRLIANKTNAIMEGSRASIVLISPTDKALELYALDGLKGAIPMGTQLPLEGTMVGKVIQENRLITTSDIRDSEFFDHRQLAQQGLLSTMSAPLGASGQVIGSLNVGSKKQDAYTKRDENLMAQIASLLGSTIESRRLFEQMETALEEAKILRQLADQSYQASADLNTVQNYDDILAVLRQHTILGQGAQNVSLNYFDHPWTEDQTPEWFNVLARWSELPTEAVSSRYPLAAFPSANELLQANAPTLIEDIATDSRVGDSARALYTQRFGAKSTIFVPMVVGGQWIGYVNGIYQQPTEFQGPDVRRLVSLVGQAAVVVQAIQRLEETQRSAGRERTIREITEKMRTATNLEQLVKIATIELGEHLSAGHAVVELGFEKSEF